MTSKGHKHGTKSPFTVIEKDATRGLKRTETTSGIGLATNVDGRGDGKGLVC